MSAQRINSADVVRVASLFLDELKADGLVGQDAELVVSRGSKTAGVPWYVKMRLDDLNTYRIPCLGDLEALTIDEAYREIVHKRSALLEYRRLMRNKNA